MIDYETLALIEQEAKLSALVTFTSKQFERSYLYGLISGQARPEESKPVQDQEVFTTLERYINLHRAFCNTTPLYGCIGYFLGSVHGATLAPDGTIQGKKLVQLSGHPAFAKGYRHGRSLIYCDGYCFNEKTSLWEQCSWTDKQVTNTFNRILWDDDDTAIPVHLRQYDVGYLLGRLSLQLFPQTERERKRYQAQQNYEKLLLLVGNNALLAPA